MAFLKLDTAILESTLWCNRDDRDVFLTALLMAEPFEVTEQIDALETRSIQPSGFVVPPGWYGLIRAAGVGIVRRALVDDSEAGLQALERLAMPDPESRSAEWDGRRLVRINGGFIALNFMRFRDRDHSAAERMKRFRERKKTRAAKTDETDTLRRNATLPLRNVTQADSRGQKQIAEAEGEEEAVLAPPSPSSSPPVEKQETRSKPETPPEVHPGGSGAGGADGILEAITEPAHRHALECYRRASSNVGTLDYLLLAVHNGQYGYPPTPWPDIGQALFEMQLSGVPKPTVNTLTGWLRGAKARAQRPPDEPGDMAHAGNGNGKHPTTDPWADMRRRVESGEFDG